MPVEETIVEETRQRVESPEEIEAREKEIREEVERQAELRVKEEIERIEREAEEKIKAAKEARESAEKAVAEAEKRAADAVKVAQAAAQQAAREAEERAEAQQAAREAEERVVAQQEARETAEKVAIQQVASESEENSIQQNYCMADVETKEASNGKIKSIIIVLSVIAGILLIAVVLFLTGVLGGKKENGDEAPVISQEQVNDKDKLETDLAEETLETTEPVETATPKPTSTPTPKPTSTPKPTATPKPKDNTYIIENSDTYWLSEEDIIELDLTEKQYRLARNEIYARHGYIFKDKSLLKYFKKKAWYNPTYTAEEFSESFLNDTERHNIELILKFENGEIQEEEESIYFAGLYSDGYYTISLQQYSSPYESQYGPCVGTMYVSSDYEDISFEIYRMNNNDYSDYRGMVSIYVREDGLSITGSIYDGADIYDFSGDYELQYHYPMP